MTRYAHRRVAPKGFTLLEALVALAILGSIGALLYRSMSTSFRAKAWVSEVNDRYHEGRQVMNRITSELRMAFLTFEVPEQLREENPAVLTRFEGSEDQIHFASTSHLRLVANARESDQAEIGYFLKNNNRRDSKYRGKTLFRRESKRLDDKYDKGGSIWPVVDGVRVFKLEYWDETKAIGDDAWQSDWDTQSDDQDLLPSRIRITLELDSGDERPPIRFVAQAAPRLRRPIAAIDSFVPQRAIRNAAQEQLDNAADPANPPNLRR
ncbi:MAG: type II secretion system protein GspJ [Bradymonadia bacterium]